jgi:AcrR family transcriptional regulator
MTAPDDPSADAPARPLRRDAEHNRRRVIDAAAQLFRERGIDVGFEEIARTAGLGVGTVYRRFPTRGALVTAMIRTHYEPALRSWEELVETQDDPRALLWEICSRIATEAATDVGLREAMFRAAGTEGVQDMQERLARLFAETVRRARRADLVRPGLEAEDLAVFTLLLSRLQPDAEEELIARYLEILLRGAGSSLGAPPALPGRAPTGAEVMAIVQRGPARRPSDSA